MTLQEECLWCMKQGSWHSAAQLYLRLTYEQQIVLVCQVARLDDGVWYCDNLAAAVSKEVRP